MWFYSALLIPTLLEAPSCLASLHPQFFSVIRSLLDGVAFPTVHFLLVTVENLTCLRKIVLLPTPTPRPREKNKTKQNPG